MLNSNKPGNFYEINIRSLMMKYPSFKEDIIDKYLPTKELTLLETPEGVPTARLENIWVHSSRAPAREAQRLISNGISKENGICLIYGFGLGYHVEELLARFPELQVLIIEPEPGLFLKALEARDLSSIISNENTGFLLDADAGSISPLLSRFRSSSIQSIKLRSVYERNAAVFDAFEQEVKIFIRKRDTNMTTLNRFGRTWTRNLFRNIEVFEKAGDSGDWYGKFKNIPALVIAAGPSLDEILPHLPALRERCVLICVDTALRAVLSAGAAPDFIVVVDPQYLNSRHLDNLLDSDRLSSSVLISESSTHPSIFRSCRLPVFFFKSVFPLGKLLEKQAGIHSELGAGGSVATTAWDLARRLGCSEVFTAGLDLGFSGSRTHCRTSLSSFLSQLRTNRRLSVEGINFAGIHNADPFEVPDNSGGRTVTDRRLIIYKSWFEGQIKLAPSERLFNLSGSGVKIDGMPFAPIGQVLVQDGKRPLIDSILRGTLAENRSKSSDMSEIGTLLDTIITECTRLEKLCGTAERIIDKLKCGDSGLPLNKAVSSLSELDAAISDSPSKELTGFIIQPVLNEIIDEERDWLENSEMLYKSILEACVYHRIHAERALNRIR